jgi:hypothetical protein
VSLRLLRGYLRKRLQPRPVSGNVLKKKANALRVCMKANVVSPALAVNIEFSTFSMLVPVPRTRQLFTHSISVALPQHQSETRQLALHCVQRGIDL